MFFLDFIALQTLLVVMNFLRNRDLNHKCFSTQLSCTSASSCSSCEHKAACVDGKKLMKGCFLLL